MPGRRPPCAWNEKSRILPCLVRLGLMGRSSSLLVSFSFNLFQGGESLDIMTTHMAVVEKHEEMTEQDPGPGPGPSLARDWLGIFRADLLL